jgi:glutamyl-tRNA reductase
VHLLLLGISHRTAPIELRERVDFQARGLENALRTLAAHSAQGAAAGEMAVLSTCNRAELYVACENVDAARAELIAFVGAFHGVDTPALEPHVYQAADLEAARHLFRVAAGLDSLVVGEPQILGQVKEAHGAARQAATAGPLLNRLFHSSFAVGKRVRTETGLGSGAVSVSYAAVALAKKIFGNLDGRAVMVIGAGEMGKLTAQHMKSQGVRNVTIVSRTMGHAARTADAIGGATATPWDDMDAALTASDIVITATGAAAPILTKARIEAAMRPRRNRPLFIIDIAVPRDVEPAAAELEDVFLYNIDDLQAAVRENMARRTSEVTRAEAIVDEELDKFGSWMRARGVIPTVVALRQSFESIRRAELDRLDFKLSGLPAEARDEARARVDEITHLIIEKLLLTPTEQLKALGDQETAAQYADAVARVFGLADSPPERDIQDSEPGGGHTERAAGRVQPFRRARTRDQR